MLTPYLRFLILPSEVSESLLSQDWYQNVSFFSQIACYRHSMLAHACFKWWNKFYFLYYKRVDCCLFLSCHFQSRLFLQILPILPILNLVSWKYICIFPRGCINFKCLSIMFPHSISSVIGIIFLYPIRNRN